MARPVSRLKADLLLGLGLRGAGALSSFALAWIMAQVFGARTVGLYQLGFVTATFLSAIALYGQDVIVVREIAPLLQQGQSGEAAQRFRGSLSLVFRLGIALMIGAALLAFPLAGYGLRETAAAPFIIILAPAVLLLAQSRVYGALLRCLGQVTLSQVLEGVSYTSFAMLGLALLWLTTKDPAPLAAPALLLAGLIGSTAIGYRASARALAAMPGEGPVIRPDLWLGARIASGPVLTQAGSWGVLLAITTLISAAEGGVFRIAVMVCMLMQLVNGSFATMAGPYLARASGSGDIGQMRRTILVAGGIGLAVSAPLGILALAVPEWIMGQFGPDFVSGAKALQWLTLGQLINVATGPVGVALIMQKRDRLVMMVEICANLLLIGVTLALLPSMGLEGAGIAMLLSALVRNGVNWLLCWFTAPRTMDPAG